jgi:threonine dehydrogenase-like Zn-dependent dehydrogenase
MATRPGSNGWPRIRASTCGAATGGHGCEVSVDASGAGSARATAILATRRWGRCVLVGEGGRLELDVSPALIHPSLTVHGSWVTSLPRMEELARNLVRWGLHPEVTVSSRHGLDDAASAYATADSGTGGKVAILPAGAGTRDAG